jgi:hypothetical protein
MKKSGWATANFESPVEAGLWLAGSLLESHLQERRVRGGPLLEKREKGRTPFSFSAYTTEDPSLPAGDVDHPPQVAGYAERS